MYLGVLFSMEDLSVYGYMTNTKVKFITVLTVPDVIIKDLDMKNVSLISEREREREREREKFACTLSPSQPIFLIELTLVLAFFLSR